MFTNQDLTCCSNSNCICINDISSNSKLTVLFPNYVIEDLFERTEHISFPPITQRYSISDVLFTGGRGVSDFSVLKYCQLNINYSLKILSKCLVMHDAYIGGRSENNIKCIMHDNLGRKN